jgi:hypothetical protein
MTDTQKESLRQELEELRRRQELEELRRKYYSCRDLLAYASGYCNADHPELSKKIEDFLKTTA